MTAQLMHDVEAFPARAERGMQRRLAARRARLSRKQPDGTPHRCKNVAYGLGWFSIGLGMTGLIAPRAVTRFLGIDDHSLLVRALGLRELLSGAGILTSSGTAEWVWARVAGDVIDLGFLGAAAASSGSNRGNIAVATGAVLGITALDAHTASRLTSLKDDRALLPLKFRAINASGSITINRSAEEVFTFWRNFENLPRIMSHLESVSIIDAETTHWVVRAPAGTCLEWDAHIIREVENELISWRSVGNASIPNFGSVRFSRAPGDRGTQVHVEIDYRPPGGKVGAIIAKFFGEDPRQRVAADLRHLKQVLETGQVVTSRSQRGACAHARK